MHAFHFGSSREPLFGVYHQSSSGTRTGGVVMCQPLGHEYIRSHRTLRMLGVRLSELRQDVLRFDYSGYGDSWGGGDVGTVTRWIADIDTAIEELKDMAAVARVSLVGVRLGATLAAVAASRRKDIETLLMWDPVVSGREYLDTLQQVQREWLRTRPKAGRGRKGAEDELIGFPITSEMCRQIEEIDLLTLEHWPARRHAMIVTPGVDTLSLERRLEVRGIDVAVHRPSDTGDWTRPSGVHRQLLAPGAVQAVTASFVARRSQ